MMQQRSEEIINNFSLFSSWEEKYEYLIDLGQAMPSLSPKFKKSKYLIQGCQSKVWLYAEEINTKLYFYGDSDALITKGIVALIVKLYSGLNKEQIINQKHKAIEAIGLRDHLSMTRANGLKLMLEKMKSYAAK